MHCIIDMTDKGCNYQLEYYPATHATHVSGHSLGFQQPVVETMTCSVGHPLGSENGYQHRQQHVHVTGHLHRRSICHMYKLTL